MQRNLTLKAIKLALITLSIAYPFAMLFYGKMAILVLLMLGILWLLRGCFESGNLKILSFFLAGFFIICVVFRGSNLAFLYPVLISLGFFIMFFYSLKNEAVITKIARLKEQNLSDEVVRYTRNLTKIWCLFFVFNAVLSLILSLMEDKIYWSFYTGIFSYLLMGALFGGEILYRKMFVLRGQG